MQTSTHRLTNHILWWLQRALLLVVVVSIGSCSARRKSALPSDVTELSSPADSLSSSFSPKPLPIDSVHVPTESIDSLTHALTKRAQTSADSIGALQLADSTLVNSSPDSIQKNLKADSLAILRGEPIDSLSTATEQTPQPEPFVLSAPVTFDAQDSMVMVGTRQLYFFGKGKIEFEKMKLESSFMRFDADSSQVYAQYILDSLGYATDLPRFSDGDQHFDSKSIKYNFRTEQGFITGVTTQQGEAYLTSSEAKRLKDNTMFLSNGRFTTCDLHEHPHFYINLTRAKVKPNDKIVTGPAYLVLADVPIYLLGLPFGFFPFNEKQTSGLVMPQYGIDPNKGLYLRSGGFYLNFNDYYDVALRGDIYTDGSWGLNATSNYQKRYRYSGSVSIGYLSTVSGDKAIAGTYSRTQDFNINWSHRQDAKADPLRTFSAQVNFATSSYNHNSTENLYNNSIRAQNNKGSSISYTRRFIGLPLTLSGSFSIDQRSRDSTVSVTLPNLNISLSSIYPFKRKARVGRERWYEKISLSYSGSLRNSITTKEHLLLRSNLVRDWRNGMQHSVPISASFDLFDYIKISPSISYNARWYTNRIKEGYDPVQKRIVPVDTTYGFYHINDFSASISASTTLYGFFKPWKIFGDRVQMIRHRVSPTISISYTPDFGTPFWGYYQTLHYQDDNGQMREHIYSPYANGMFGVPGRGKSGIINFGLENNLEMKWRNRADSTAQTQEIEGVPAGDKQMFKKISLIDQLGANISYNMAADSFQWSNISAHIALRLSKTFVLRLNGTFETYLYDYTLVENGTPIPRRINKLRILNGKGPGRLTGTGTSFSYTFTTDTFRKLGKWFSELWGGDQKDEQKEAQSDRGNGFPREGDRPISENPRPSTNDTPFSGTPTGGTESLTYDPYGYLSYQYPWSFSFNYSLNMGYDYQKFNIRTKEYPYKFTQNLSFRGNIQPTANWSFSFDANYNFDLKKITNMTISISRDMHCWQLTGSVIPFGPYKSFNVTIAVKAQILKALKWDKTSLPGGENGAWWY